MREEDMKENKKDGSTNYNCFNHSGFGKYTGSNVAECLRSSGGDLGGGSENIVLAPHGRKLGRCAQQTTSGVNRNR